MTTQPGVYHDMPFDEYLALDACSNSILSKMATSPADAKYSMENLGEESPAMAFGTAAHLAVLEQEKFTTVYQQEPSLSGRLTKKGELSKRPRMSDSFKEECSIIEGNGYKIISAADFCRAIHISDCIHQHDAAGKLLRKATGTEVSLIWMDNGLRCKARVDAMKETVKGWLCDLKTTRNFPSWSPWEFTKLGIYRQAAWYLRGAKALGLDCSTFFVIAVDNGPVTKVRCDRVDDMALKAGAIEADTLFHRYIQCKKTGQWPGDVPGLGVVEITDKRLEQLMPQERTG